MPNRIFLIEEQKAFIYMLQDQVKERGQQLKIERAARLQAEENNRRLQAMLDSRCGITNYREGSE